MMKIFLILAVICYLLCLYLAWGKVRENEKWEKDIVNSSGVTLTAIMTSYALISGGEVKIIEVNPPINSEIAFGWATYICLSNIGHQYFVNENKLAHTNISFKEFLALTETANFKKCKTNIINDAKIKVYHAKIISFALAFVSILILYALLLASTYIMKWAMQK